MQALVLLNHLVANAHGLAVRVTDGCAHIRQIQLLLELLEPFLARIARRLSARRVGCGRRSGSDLLGGRSLLLLRLLGLLFGLLLRLLRRGVDLLLIVLGLGRLVLNLLLPLVLITIQLLCVIATAFSTFVLAITLNFYFVLVLIHNGLSIWVDRLLISNFLVIVILGVLQFLKALVVAIFFLFGLLGCRLVFLFSLFIGVFILQSGRNVSLHFLLFLRLLRLILLSRLLLLFFLSILRHGHEGSHDILGSLLHGLFIDFNRLLSLLVVRFRGRLFLSLFDLFLDLDFLLHLCYFVLDLSSWLFDDLEGHLGRCLIDGLSLVHLLRW